MFLILASKGMTKHHGCQKQIRVPRSRAFQTHNAMREEILQALEPLIFDSMHYAYDVREEFERKFAKEMQQEYAVSIHSGTVGLFLALRACGVGFGDEVITVGNSDISTTAAVHHCGAKSVLCDVLASDYTIDPELVESLITKQTRAILPVDLYGHPADVKKLRDIADTYSLKIVEDAALASGAYDHSKPVGAYADATIFSFAPFKPLGSVGNGAMVVTSNPEIEEQLHLLVSYGHARNVDLVPYGHQHFTGEGYNVPLDGLQAALLMVKLPYLAEWTKKRQAIAQAYHEKLLGTSAILPTLRPQSSPTFRSYTIRTNRQRDIHAELRKAGVEVVLHYAPAIYRHVVYDGQLPNSHALPVTDQLATELLCLPVTIELTDEDINFVTTKLRDLLDE